MRKTVMIFALAATVALAGCNTVSGAGKDVSSAGQAVTKAADENK
ncbi:MAG: entericidin A/B family lipoprotein [Sphingomonas bacterium]